MKQHEHSVVVGRSPAAGHRKQVITSFFASPPKQAEANLALSTGASMGRPGSADGGAASESSQHVDHAARF